MSVSYGPKLGLMINALTGDAHDAAFRALLRANDQLIFLSVINRTTSSPPGSPANGDAYLVASGASGAWAGKTGSLAVWTTDNPAAVSGEWEFYTPRAGWVLYSVGDGSFYGYSGSAWTGIGGGSGTLAGDGDVVIASAANNDVLTYETSSTKWKNKPPSGGGGGSSGFGSLVGFRRTAFMIHQTGASMDAIGDLASATGTWSTNVGPSGANTQAAAWNGHSSSADSYAGMSGGANWLWSTNMHAFFSAYSYQTSSLRMYLGLFDSGVSTGTLFATDALTASKYAAFRFSSVASDPHIQCITCDGSAQTVVDSGVSMDTKTHKYLVVCNDAIPNVQFYIDGTLVATITTHLPSGAGTLRYIAGIADEGAAADICVSAIVIQSDL